MDPENFVRGFFGVFLFYFRLVDEHDKGREDPNQDPNTTKTGHHRPASKRHLNGISL